MLGAVKGTEHAEWIAGLLNKFEGRRYSRSEYTGLFARPGQRSHC